MRRLIINADDYALTAGVSAGIRYAHLHGVVSTTTAMMNLDSAADEVSRARVECPDLGLGVHLVLTTGRPIRPAGKVRTLIGRDGRFWSRTEFPQAYGIIDPNELRDEWSAQIDVFLASGAALDHLDTHQHIACLHEIGMDVFLTLAEQLKVPIRHPECALQRIPSRVESRIGGGQSASLLRHLVLLDRAVSRHRVRYPDRMIGCFGGTTVSEAVLLSIIDQLPEGTAELMCHPGFVDEELVRCSGYTMPRLQELRALTSHRVRERIVERNIGLMTFRNL